MFLSLLDPAQRVLFTRAARLLIEADAIAHEHELEMLDAIQSETGLTEIPEPGDADELAEQAVALLTDATQRNAFVAELAGVAVIDGDEHGAERELLQRFADVLGSAIVSTSSLPSRTTRAIWACADAS